LDELVGQSDRALVCEAMKGLQNYSERLMSTALRRLKAGVYRAEDWMDDDGTGQRDIALRVAVRIGRGRAIVDFTGTSEQVAGGINANEAITLAAVLYVFQCVAGAVIPANAGLMRPIIVITPPGTVLNARFPAAVAGGNVETSQRIVDVVLKALAAAAPERIPAASNGSMNNLALGGYDPFRGREFAYYETIAGGAGGGPSLPGASAVHTHMTNTWNTPVEAIEAAYPLRVGRYRVRRGSGGSGRHRGGDGVLREFEFLSSMQMTLLTERRRIPPYGLQGGKNARVGRNTFFHGAKVENLPAKISLRVSAGDRVRIETPGGGGWGSKRGNRS
jgi:N-methylhydantoinase B